MSSAPSPAEIAADATWLAQALDPAAGLVRLVRLTPQDYRDAAFLDDRMFTRPLAAEVAPWQGVAGALPPNARRDARWIFHIGHVGSTLVARLLGELEHVLSVREPRLLRDLTTVDPERRRDMAATATALYSRTFAPAEIALVKATSFVSEIASELVPAGGRCLFMYASPQAYIEGILAGENSVQELRALADARQRRMSSRVERMAAATYADLAAAAWACEVTALERAANEIGEEAVIWADFDRMLAEMDQWMERVAIFLELPATGERLAEINSGPLLRRYSKATEYEYSPDLRRALLDEARRMHASDIDKALALLHNAARSSPLLERALSRATSET